VLRSRGHDAKVFAAASGALDALAAASFKLEVVDLTAAGLDGGGLPPTAGRPGGTWTSSWLSPAAAGEPSKKAILRGADDYLVLLEEAELLDLRLTIAGRKELLSLACGDLGFARQFDDRHTPKLTSAQPFVCQQTHAGGVASARSVGSEQ
jgi:hypothetical protein